MKCGSQNNPLINSYPTKLSCNISLEKKSLCFKNGNAEKYHNKSLGLALHLAHIAAALIGENIVIFDSHKIIDWTSYICVVSVSNKLQSTAILLEMEREAKIHYRRASTLKLTKTEWEILDLGDVIFHVMTDRQREFYDLESFYSTFEEIIPDEKYV